MAMLESKAQEVCGESDLKMRSASPAHARHLLIRCSSIITVTLKELLTVSRLKGKEKLVTSQMAIKLEAVFNYISNNPD